MTIPLKPFYFVRHGQTQWNRLGIPMGTRDVLLNEQGKQQASGAGSRLQSEPIDCIVTSSLARAKETADIISSIIQKPITVIDDLKEHGGGSSFDFSQRVAQGLKDALALSGTVLIVSHGDVYNVISKMLGVPAMSLGNCEIMYHQPPENSEGSWLPTNLSESK